MNNFLPSKHYDTRTVQTSEPWIPRSYQARGVEWLLSHACGALFFTPGLGKSSVTLAAFSELLSRKVARTMLIIAPLRVCQFVWRQEGAKWDQFTHLRFSLLHGKDKLKALEADADIYLINPEGIPWLLDNLEGFPFDTLCFDELTLFKESRGKRYKMLRKRTRKVARRWGLTGTPASNGYLDLFGQMLMLDEGATLGKYITHYRHMYFIPDYLGYNWTLRKGAKEQIQAKLREVALYIDGEQETDVPKLVDDIRVLDMDDKARVRYKEMADSMLTHVSEQKVTAANAGVVVGKLRQMANGEVYTVEDTERVSAHLHNAKLDALAELLDELAGQQCLIFYEFKHDLERFRKKFGKDIPVLSRDKPGNATVGQWNKGQIPYLFVHPKCVHPDTLVLTEYRGWVKIIHVTEEERVFDGVEFVRHGGCRASGVREVIQRFGLILTPDHPILINGEWVEAISVPDTQAAKRKARYAYGGSDSSVSALLSVWEGVQETKAKRRTCQQTEKKALSGLLRRLFSQNDRHTALQHMEGNAAKDGKRIRPRFQTLRRSWDNCHKKVAYVCRVLGSHARRVRRQLNIGQAQCRWPLQQAQLSVGIQHGATSEQANHPQGVFQRTRNSSRSVLQGSKRKPWSYHALFGALRDRRQSPGSVQQVHVPEKQKITVYDLINCGPRHRFAVRNAEGEVFIVHNSGGHGLNLQESGAQHICWFSLPWSCDLYEQAIRRVQRSGNKSKKVINHILMVRDTIDEVVLASLREKQITQTELLRQLIDKEVTTMGWNTKTAETEHSTDGEPTKLKGWGSVTGDDSEDDSRAALKAKLAGKKDTAPSEDAEGEEPKKAATKKTVAKKSAAKKTKPKPAVHPGFSKKVQDAFAGKVSPAEEAEEAEVAQDDTPEKKPKPVSTPAPDTQALAVAVVDELLKRLKSL